MELNMRNVSRYRPWRGITIQGEIVYGQLLNAMVDENLESEIWLAQDVSHTEEKPIIGSCVRVHSHTLMRFTKYFIDGVPVYEGDSLVFECLNGDAVHKVFMTSYMHRVEGPAVITTDGEKQLGVIIENEHPTLQRLEDETEDGRQQPILPEVESEVVSVEDGLSNQ